MCKTVKHFDNNRLLQHIIIYVVIHIDTIINVDYPKKFKKSIHKMFFNKSRLLHV